MTVAKRLFEIAALLQEGCNGRVEPGWFIERDRKRKRKRKRERNRERERERKREKR